MKIYEKDEYLFHVINTINMEEVYRAMTELLTSPEIENADYRRVTPVICYHMDTFDNDYLCFKPSELLERVSPDFDIHADFYYEEDGLCYSLSKNEYQKHVLDYVNEIIVYTEQNGWKLTSSNIINRILLSEKGTLFDCDGTRYVKEVQEEEKSMDTMVDTDRMGAVKVTIFESEEEAREHGYGYYYTDHAEKRKKDVFTKSKPNNPYSIEVAVVYTET